MSILAPADQPVFEAVLTPHRSISKTGALWLVACVAGIWGVMSLSFAAMGAWPVLWFFGLDIVLFGWLIWLNLRGARCKETVSVSRTLLEVKRFGANGRNFEWHRFNPFGTKLDVARHEEYGVTKLSLVTHGKPKVSIGDFLNPDDKESFGKALRLAMAKVRS